MSNTCPRCTKTVSEGAHTCTPTPFVRKIEAERDAALTALADLTAAAQAIIDRWQSPNWEWSKQGPTADLINVLGRAVERAEALRD